MTLRTDDAGATGNPVINVNNDSGANYDRSNLQVVNTTVSGTPTLADTKWVTAIHGSGGSANYASSLNLKFPNYAGTTFFKIADGALTVLDATAANTRIANFSWGWRSTAAITRISVAAAAGQKLKVGSQLLVYKRLSA